MKVLICTLTVMLVGSTALANRSTFRCVGATAGGSGELVIDLAYSNPGATYRCASQNTVNLYAHLDGAPQNPGCSNYNNAKRASKQLAEGIFLGDVLMAQNSGSCKVKVDLSRQPALAGVVPGSSVWIAGQYGFGHNWGCSSGIGNQAVTFKMPEVAIPLSAKAAKGPGTKIESKSSPSRIDVNRASATELRTLPGIGPAAAQKIIAARPRGGFGRITDLARVPGLSPRTVQGLKGLAVARRR